MFKQRHKGFSGFTHLSIAALLAGAVLSFTSLPSSFGWGVATTALMVFAVSGGSLLPDLDSSPLEGGGSSAYYELGIVGKLLTTAMITISGIYYTIVHGPGDKDIKSQHRLIWHAPILPIAMAVLTKFFLNEKYDAMWFVSVIVIIISVFLGSGVLLFRIFGLVNKQRLGEKLSWVVTIATGALVCLRMDIDGIEQMAYAVWIGYLIHIISDGFTQGGVPWFHPIPVPRRGGLAFWWKPHILTFPLSIRTNSMVDTVIGYSCFGGFLFILATIVYQHIGG